MITSAKISNFLIWPVLMLGVFLSGCSHTSELFSGDPVYDTENTGYSIIYYIHADSDYLYHDADGEPVRGNSKVVEAAIRNAEYAKSGEVFVFYQRPQKKFLGLFPRKSSHFYHYVNGELTSHVKYRHTDKKEDFLTSETWLFNHYRIHNGNNDRQNYFLFFGHEIPDDNGQKYHSTLPDIAVNTGTFSAGIQNFLTADDQRFDLIVLSTCNNGTPVMAMHLMPFSDLLLASPQNLHLSHIDTESLGLLESNHKITTAELAYYMADQTYRRLELEILTAITFTVYDFKMIRQQQNELHDIVALLQTFDGKQYFSDNIDCKQIQFFDEHTFSKGVNTWFKPARFGRRALSTSHSGWGCKPVLKK